MNAAPSPSAAAGQLRHVAYDRAIAKGIFEPKQYPQLLSLGKKLELGTESAFRGAFWQAATMDLAGSEF